MLITFFTSCRKDIDQPGDGPTYTITGKLYLDCSMQPMSNQKVDLFQTYSSTLGGNLNGGILAETITDSDGYFKFEFKDLDGLEEKIRIPTGQGYKVLMDYIPQNQSFYDIDVIANPTSHIKVSLNATNSYTSSDTLYLTDFRNLSQKLKIAGPFTNSIAYVANNFGIINNTFSGSSEELAYAINNSTWKFVSFQFKTCDTTDVVISIQ